MSDETLKDPVDPVRRPPRRSRRLSPAERSRDFVAEAAEFFAEVGFEGGTRELARRLGVTQPLLYRYFDSKDDLIRAVYQRVYLDRWDPAWDDLLEDRAVPFRERMERFYLAYTERIFTREWIRIYLFAGLRGVQINQWYNQLVEPRILKRVVAGLRAEAGVPEEPPASREEMELVWNFHGGLVYYGVRKYIYDLETLDDRETVIRNALDVFFAGAPAVIARIAPRAVPCASVPAAGPDGDRRRVRGAAGGSKTGAGGSGDQAAIRLPRGG